MDHAVKTVVSHARTAAPFFADLYKSLPSDCNLTDLPVIDHAAYWTAHGSDPQRVMTGPQLDGVVMRTGGTTSRPKTTAYSQVELQRTASLLASGLLAAGVRAGDRIANMFYAGNLYASFLLHVLSIMALPLPVVHVPIGGLTELPEAVHLVDQCDATVLLTTATSLVKMANHLTREARQLPRVRCCLFGGEPLFCEQEAAIRKAFPCAIVRSCIYGSIDAGVLAKAAPGEDTRLYQAFTDTVVVEIVQNDPGHTPIYENGAPGLLVATNTLRQLAPVIRYPTGDRAAWVDRDKGTFLLLGRAGQAVRLGPVSIDVADLRDIVSDTLSPLGLTIQGVQAVICRTGGLDQLQCLVAAQGRSAVGSSETSLSESVLARLYIQRPMLKQHIELSLVAPAVVRFVEFEALRLSSGSHKVRDVVDTRFEPDR